MGTKAAVTQGSSTPDAVVNLGKIKCPKCKSSIELSEAMVGPLLAAEQQRYAADLEIVRANLTNEAKRWADEKSAELIAAAKSNVAVAADQMREMEVKLLAAQNEQAEAVRLKTALAEERRELELTISRRVQAASESQMIAAQRAARDEAQIEIAARDEKLRNLTTQIEDLKQRAAQGSQQLQGEAQEIVLETTLKTAFPIDSVEPVAKFKFGGDVWQRVMGPTGTMLGSILWESKRTKTWSAGWLGKMRQDQREAKADIAVIATQVVPEGVSGFALMEGVWVCEFRYALPLAVAMRQSIIDLASVRTSSAGIATKTEMLYAYLTGSQFRLRVNAVVEAFNTLRRDLEAERTAITRLWAKREGQLTIAATSMAMLYGDVEAIAGGAVPEIVGLALPATGDGGSGDNVRTPL